MLRMTTRVVVIYKHNFSAALRMTVTIKKEKAYD